MELLKEYVAHKWSPSTPSLAPTPVPPMTGEVLEPTLFCVPVYRPEAASWPDMLPPSLLLILVTAQERQADSVAKIVLDVKWL